MKHHHSLIVTAVLCGALALPAFAQTTPAQPVVTPAPMQLAYYKCWWHHGYRVCRHYHNYRHHCVTRCWITHHGYKKCRCVY